MGPADDATLRVEVVYCAGTAQVDQVELMLPAGATVADALDASGVLQRHALDAAGVRVGIWGRVQPLATALRDRDRVELYRALRVEPKEARRLRYKRAKRADAA